MHVVIVESSRIYRNVQTRATIHTYIFFVTLLLNFNAAVDSKYISDNEYGISFPFHSHLDPFSHCNSNVMQEQ